MLDVQVTRDMIKSLRLGKVKRLKILKLIGELTGQNFIKKNKVAFDATKLSVRKGEIVYG